MRARCQLRPSSQKIKFSTIFGPDGATRGEEGLTLVELVVVIVILPIVVGGIAIALMGVLQNESTTFNRVADTADAQISSANFARDVQNASSITTGQPSNQCINGGSYPLTTGEYPPPGSTELLGLRWSQNNFRTITATLTGNNIITSSNADFTSTDSGATVSDAAGYIQSGTTIKQWASALPPDTTTSVQLSKATGSDPSPDTVTVSQSQNWQVTYWDVPYGTMHQLVRMLCVVQASVPTYISQQVVAHDLPANQGPATVSCNSTAQCTTMSLANTWFPTAGITDISLSSAEPASGYLFNLSATPRNSTPTSQGSLAGAQASVPLLVTGAAAVTVPSSSTLNVPGEIALDSQNASFTGSGTLTDPTGPILVNQCTGVTHQNTCPNVTLTYTGTCNCATPTSMTSSIATPVLQPPATSPQTCSGVNVTCSPGTYASSVNVSGNVTFSPGVYTFGAGLTIGSGSVVTGNGVFFYFSGSKSLGIASGDVVDLTPPASGPYVGVLVYQLGTNTAPMFLGSAGSGTINTYAGAVEAPGAAINLGSSGDNFTVASLVASSVSLGSTNVTVTIG